MKFRVGYLYNDFSLSWLCGLSVQNTFVKIWQHVQYFQFLYIFCDEISEF